MLNTKETIPNRIAKFIREKRQARGETQEELAIRALGSKKHRSYITKIENGRTIGLFTLEKILIALESNIEFIED
ncbi:helix-turn-helix domain-containing protein [Thalassobellus suaedae]|uniref:Helix-turn-helix transcriptional regulator n=1 Tax=Thalassobellus suaedae TaxID=3074124 RepID=A0ABY9XWF6_9FLAO|nr:helix-turn-helix transcriptional regulator [Flavobacteriaceae bacterium HL-DH14]